MTSRKAPDIPELKTEGPLKEKDEQSQAIEQQRKLSEIALEKWRRLKEKIKHSFKNCEALLSTVKKTMINE